MTARPYPSLRVPYPHLTVHVGDSLTHNYSQPCTPGKMWPTQLKGLLQSLGANIRPYNQGISGNTSGNMRGRMANYVINGVPEVAFIGTATNDLSPGTVAASPSPTATGVSVGSGEGAKYSIGGWIVINGQSRQLTGVSTDALSWTTPLSGAPTAGTTVSHDTTQNFTDIVNYLIAAGTTRFMLIGPAYVNYAGGSGDYYGITTVTSAADTTHVTVASLTGSSGTTLAANGYCVINGEERLITAINTLTLTLSTPLSTIPTAGTTVSKSYAIHAGMRAIIKSLTATLAAANPTKSIVYCNLHGYQYNLIAAGTVTQGNDLAWYNYVGNYHFSPAGSLMFAQAVLATINTTSGWLAALS